MSPTALTVIGSAVVALIAAFGGVAGAAVAARASRRATQDPSGNTLSTRVEKLEATVQIMRRREVWHERKEDILIDVLRENRIPIPEMPPPPEAYPSV